VRFARAPSRNAESVPPSRTSVPIDDWSPPDGLYAPLIEVGSPRPYDGDRWFRAADLADLATGALRNVLDEVEASRGYRDGKSQGGGFALLFSGMALGVVLRVVDGRAVPQLKPAETWVELSARGSPMAVRVAGGELQPASIADLRDNLRMFFGPIFLALNELTRFPLVGQWAQLASAIASTLLGTPHISQARALAFLDDLFETDDLLRRAQPHIAWTPYHDEQRAYATRKVCCFNYRGFSGAYCTAQCPLVPVAEREAAAVHLMDG